MLTVAQLLLQFFPGSFRAGFDLEVWLRTVSGPVRAAERWLRSLPADLKTRSVPSVMTLVEPEHWLRFLNVCFLASYFLLINPQWPRWGALSIKSTCLPLVKNPIKAESKP